MGYPTIVFNSSTGSDTAASGAGPATALTGSAASYSGSVVTLDGSPDLSGVATDSTHVLYLVTSTGRKFFAITAKDNTAKTVTVADAPAGTASGLSWAIGGKRATWDNTNSRLLFSTDRKAYWTIRTETDQTITSTALNMGSTVGLLGMVIEGDDPTTLRVINQTANAATMTGTGSIIVRNLKITNSNGTKSNAVGVDASNPDEYFIFQNCVFGDATNQLISAFGPYSYLICEGVVVQHCTGGQGSLSINSRQFLVNFQYIHNGGSWSTTYAGSTYINCLFAGNTGDGVTTQIGGSYTFVNCTFANNTGDGLDSSALNAGYIIHNCLFANNGNYGHRGGGANPTVGFPPSSIGNVYHNNTSGSINNYPAGYDDRTLDPQFTDAAGGNWSVGTNLKAGAHYARYPHATTVSYLDVGAIQRQEPTAGPAAVIRAITNIGTY